MKYDVSLQTISWFNQQRQAGMLEISPKFQRRPVWLLKERTELIVTVLSELPFPEIYIQTITDTQSGDQKHVVVDGQQRITSLLMFIDHEFSLPDYGVWKGRDFRGLEDDEKKRFWAYKIVVRTLEETNEAEIRDLFTRLNTNNIALNDQELRNARYLGRFKQSAERLAEHPFFQTIAFFTAREVRRMEDIEFVSELLLRAVEGLTNKKDLLEDAYADYDEEFPGEAEYENEVNVAISLMQSITSDANKSLVRTKSNFYSLFGACLRYLREQKRNAFLRPDAVSASITGLLTSVKSFDPQEADPMITDYYNAVSRAASDRNRRELREAILVDIISRADSSMI